MFGIIVAGRLVQTDFEQVTATQFVFNVEAAEQINHFVVFLTGTTPFPESYGAAVYFSWPSIDGSQAWHLIGHLTNQKPSAIFKVAAIKPAEVAAVNPFITAQRINAHWAQVGLSVEPVSVLSQQTPETSTKVSSISDFMEYSQKMLQNLLNFASSFAVTQSQMVPNPTETYIPASTLNLWYTNFRRKLELSPDFWRT